MKKINDLIRLHEFDSECDKVINRDGVSIVIEKCSQKFITSHPSMNVVYFNFILDFSINVETKISGISSPYIFSPTSYIVVISVQFLSYGIVVG